MMRKLMITPIAAAAFVAVSTASVSAMHGGGMGHGGFGHVGGFGHPGGFGRFGGIRPLGFHAGPYPFRFRRFFNNRVVLFGVGFPYGYFDACYAQVWTPWGWGWTYVCY